MDFKNAAELLTLCEKEKCPISEIMKRRECDLAETTMEKVEARMRKALSIMRKSSSEPLTSPRRSMGGLLGGEAQLVERHRQEGKSVCGNVLSRAVAYAMGVLEVNSSMGLIVAAPTAGSSGVVPGVFLALQKAVLMKSCWPPCTIPAPSAFWPCAMPRWPVRSADARPKWEWLPPWPPREPWS